MLPLRSSPALRRSSSRATPLIAHLSASRSASTSYRPSLSLGESSKLSGSVYGRRSIHLSTSLLKDKRWLNSTDEEKQAQKDKKEEEEGSGEKSETIASKEKEAEEKEVEVDKPESSKTAQDRAAKAAKEAESKTPTAETTSSTSANADSTSSSSPVDGAVPPSTGKEIAKVNIPDVFPQVLALPITLRPLFPTFYKAVTITHPPVIKAIRELLAHGQPYIGAFLFKDSESDADVITSLDQVHPVGVFAQITSTFEPPEKKTGKDGKPDATEPKALTVVLYPHRRIRIDELVSSASQGGSVPLARVVEEIQREQTDDEGEVSSFERDVPSVDSVREELGTAPSERKEDGELCGFTPLGQG